MNLSTAILVERSFKKIFKNVAEKFGEPVNNIQLGIYYTNSLHKYIAYKNFNDGLDIVLSDYMDVITSSLAGGAIDAGMAGWGKRYAEQLSSQLDRSVEVNEISILMCYNESGMPRAVLMCSDKKIREINIEKEF